ncbi:MAG: beta-lactamase family protein [Candidatus Eremiobacteraeota bacterium]|nr:beta-lactamase family protein [Candidatus Eremiobacteraeota bacterium]
MSAIDVENALAYVRQQGSEACIISQAGRITGEFFAAGFDGGTAHALYSGTKSFWGPLAIRARRDGLLDLDEAVSDTIVEWRADPRKRRITVRMLLSLTAGFAFGGVGATVPTYERALAVPLRGNPGAAFTYGGIPLQIFGALLARKLAAQKLTPHDYLRERLLGPAGVVVQSWRTLKDGTSPLPTGAFVSAKNWLAYGRYISDHRAEFAECFVGSAANPRYGLGWWLQLKGAPADLFYASGSGGQALYVVPLAQLVIAHFCRGRGYNHGAFLRRLFAPSSPRKR